MAKKKLKTIRRSRRAPFPRSVPKVLKRKLGRTEAPFIPAHIRVFGRNLSQDKRSAIRKKLGRRLGKFAPAIERVSVRVKDVNGPRGGIDQLCRIKVVLSDLPSVIFEALDNVLDRAIGRALAGTERAVRKSVRRRRMKPVKNQARSRADIGWSD